jgi:cytochrome c-type biogenesis protein CcmH
MIAFWVVAALLVAGALLFLLPPLFSKRSGPAPEAALRLPFYRAQLAELNADFEQRNITQTQFEETKRELERRVLEEYRPDGPAPATVQHRTWLAPLIVALAVPLAAIPLYLRLGTPQLLAQRPEEPPVKMEDMTERQFVFMVQKLASSLRAKPNDARGWAMLGRSYQALGRLTDAAEAYGRAAVLVPENADLLAEYAGALAAAKNNDLSGRPSELIEQALKIDPKSQRALALAGAAAYERKDLQAAVGYWKRLRELLPADEEFAKQVEQSIVAARAQLEGKTLGAGGPAVNDSAAKADANVAGTVTLSDALKSKAAPEDQVFIFARAVNGPRMPLAVLRATAKELPKSFSLDDSMAMAPAMKLSRFPEVVVEARISKSGNAQPKSGDLEGSSGTVKLGANHLNIVIDRVVP